MIATAGLAVLLVLTLGRLVWVERQRAADRAAVDRILARVASQAAERRERARQALGAAEQQNRDEAEYVARVRAEAGAGRPAGCGCECCTGGFCGGCGHAGCGLRGKSGQIPL